MRRILAVFAALMTALTLLCIPADAAGAQFSLRYVPRTDRGALFYLDISCDGTVSAASMELSLDSSLVEYRSVEALAATSTVKARADGGSVTIIFADSAGVSGGLCRLTLKALGDGSASFTLRMTQGVDGNLNYMELPAACSLTVSLGEAGSSGSSGSSSSGSRASHGGSTSNKSGSSTDSNLAADDLSTGDEASVRVIRDLSRGDGTHLFLIGSGVGGIAVLLVILGFVLGKRSRNRKKPAAENGGEVKERTEKEE